jgi:glutamine synthetase
VWGEVTIPSAAAATYPKLHKLPPLPPTHSVARMKTARGGASSAAETAASAAKARKARQRRKATSNSNSNSHSNSDSKPREYIRFEMVDYNCKALSKVVPARHKEDAVFMYSGALAMGANAEVLTFPDAVGSLGCPSAELLPDWSTLQRLPWAEGGAVQRVYCEQMAPDGQGPSPAVPRAACRRLLAELAAWEGRGLEMLQASELEFCVCHPAGSFAAAAAGPTPLFEGVDIFATLQMTKCAELLSAIEGGMAVVGLDIKTMNAEYGKGQLEITMAPARGIKACDNAATFRTGVKEICQQRGLLASFFSYPFGASGVGNGGHFNFSLWQGETSVMQAAPSPGGSASESEAAALGMSKTAQSFLAGVLAHVPAMEAFCAPTPACYSRHGHWAPAKADWGPDDRMCCVRVKSAPAPAGSNCYMELRLPSAAACPYLIVAALVAAGLDGLRRELPLPPPRDESAAAEIPTSLEAALAALEADSYILEAMGPTLVEWYCGVKRAENAVIEKALEGADGEQDRLARQTAALQHMYVEYV